MFLKLSWFMSFVRNYGRSCVSAGATHRGSARPINEDSLLDLPALGVWAVADGMGGHNAGEYASNSVVRALESVSPAPVLATLVERVRPRNRGDECEPLCDRSPARSTEEVLRLDRVDEGVQPGDLFLLCTDGLTKFVDDADIVAALRRKEGKSRADALIATGLAKGTRDKHHCPGHRGIAMNEPAPALP
jgi:serine/threonine protein phosphatase PrpC